MKTLRQVILATANYYRQQISEDVLEMYAEDLADLSPELCIAGYNQYRRNPANKTFPLPAQIRELVNPGEFIGAEVQAREIAARIIGAISKFGWNNGREAQVYIGPIGWSVVLSSGGWSKLCEDVGPGYDKINPATLQAQLRDRIEGIVRYGGDALERKILSIERREARKELEPGGDILKMIMAPIDDGPESA